MDIRKCNKCHIEKPLTDFYARKDVLNGRKGHCKSCDHKLSIACTAKRAATDSEYRAMKVRRTAEWRKKNPEKARINSRKGSAKYQDKCTELMNDVYVKHSLATWRQSFGGPVPPQIIELQRERLKIKRQLNKGNKK